MHEKHNGLARVAPKGCRIGKRVLTKGGPIRKVDKKGNLKPDKRKFKDVCHAEGQDVCHTEGQDVCHTEGQDVCHTEGQDVCHTEGQRAPWSPAWLALQPCPCLLPTGIAPT